MTKEEFLKENGYKETFTSTAGKVTVVKVYFHDGDTVKKGEKIFDFKSSDKTNASFTADASGQIKYCFKSVPAEMDSSEIFAIIEDTKMSRLWDEKSAEYKKLVEEHRNRGDLIEWWLKERDGNADIHHIIGAFATEDEVSSYKESLFPHIEALIEEHKEKGDFEEWLFECKKKDDKRYKGILTRNNTKIILREKFQKEISEHRTSGDLTDYLWEIIEKYNLNWWCLYTDYFSSEDEKNAKVDRPLEYFILKDLLKGEEKKELKCLRDIVICFGESFEDTMTWDGSDEFKYIFKLYQSPENSIEHKRYEKIRSRITKAETLEKLDASIKETENSLKHKIEILKNNKKVKTISIISLCSIIVILLGVFFVHRAITKDARLAKQEAQRIEKIKVKNAKNFAKNQANDLAQLEKLGSAKLKMQDILVSTSEPSMYIIAPMSYDTKKFVEDNSHDKGLFGTKDNSVERLTILESCITDFQNSIDSKTGVSFLDRSKISQIEKEHKFQLGDWSNNKKTAEVGKALNANILLFLDKFGFIDNGSGEYRFEAKFVDINTMQSTSYNVVYQNAKKKVVTPGVVQTISFRDFTPVSTKRNPFADEFELKTLKGFRTVQKNDLKEVSPLGQVTKVELSEFDTKAPVTDLFNASSIYFDGFGSVEFTYADKKENSTYTFDAIEMNLERIGNLFFTDGKIGTLTVKTDSGYKKYDVFTENNREYYILLGSVTLEKATVHYYLQMVKQ